jgi:hypothetical protein
LDIYQISVDLKDGVRDTQFADAIGAYLGALKQQGKIESWRLVRRKLGFGIAGLGEFQVLIETRDMAQLDAAFAFVAARDEPIEGAHFSVNSLVKNFQAGLYRDYPDPMRVHGQEKF